MASLSTATALRELLGRTLDADARCVVLGDSVARQGGTGGVFAGLADAHPDRVLDLPVADRAALGFAVGLALGGQRAVVELSASGRLAACLEVLAEAGSVAAAGEFSVPLVVRVPTGGQAGDRVDRPMARALLDLPGVTVLCPSSADTVLGAWELALASRSPVVILEPRALLTRRTAAPTAVAPGRARVLREGHHVTLVAAGSSVPAALAAADTLAAEGIHADVVDLVCLAPLDADTLGARVRATGRVVVVRPAEGVIDAAVLAAALDGAFLYLEAPPASADSDESAVVEQARAAVHY